MPNLSLIVAIDEKGGMGIHNRLPWHLPADLAYFKKVTMGKPIIMGRKTYASIGRPLPGRLNIVLSRGAPQIAGVQVVGDLDAALACAKDASEVMVIGGVAVFKAALAYADKLYLTRIHHVFEADVFFPRLDISQWDEELLEVRKADTKNPYDLSFYCYKRKKTSNKH